ncbi:MAG: hypothetical protein ACFFFK_12715 [Candidatus Thorarchaeota archaeon]
MSREGVNTERSYGFYITAIVMLALISWIFFWPLTFSNAISVADIPSIIGFIAIMIFSLVGCGLPSRDRPHFQFHYHGEEFPVMDELYEEVME